MKYLAKNIGIFVNISLQGQEIYSEEVSGMLLMTTFLSRIITSYHFHKKKFVSVKIGLQTFERLILRSNNRINCAHDFAAINYY